MYMETIIKIILGLYLISEPAIVTKTAYSPEVNQCDDDPFIASCGPVKACTLALSRDLKKGCGSIVIVPGDHSCFWIRTVNDTMHKRKENWIDLFYFDKQQALDHGIERKQLIFIFR
jgi:hypothetical protein